jgi:glutamate synthase (NADPH/NADH) small chain
VTQIEIMPKPPEERSASTPWPEWPYQLRTSSSHKEGCERRWNLNSLRFVGEGGNVAGVEVETVEWEFSPEGRPAKFRSVPGTKETIKADLVFLAMGFTGVPADNPIISQLGLAQTPRTALVSDSARNIFCVGDCASGASLVVRALAGGKSIPLD